MGVQNNAVVSLFRDKKRFADLFNAVVFCGEERIKADKLTIVDSESDIILKNKNKRKKGTHRYRDIIMRWQCRKISVILACEIQDKVHYAMAVRNMVYDGMTYSDQIREIWNCLTDKEKKDMNGKEYLSGFRKNDKLCPVITLVFYYGDEWDAAMEMYDMFALDEIPDKKMLEKYVPNYRINLVNPNKIADCKIFKSDLQLIFGMLQCKQNKNSLQNYMNENSEYFSCVDNDTAYAISALLQSEKWLNKILDEDKGEAKNMCQALQELYEEGVNQGIEKGIEKGIEEGILRGQASAIIEMVVMFRDMSFTDEMIVDKLISYFHMDEEAAANYL